LPVGFQLAAASEEEEEEEEECEHAQKTTGYGMLASWYPPTAGVIYRRCRGIVTFKPCCPPFERLAPAVTPPPSASRTEAISKSATLPHFRTAHTGASRSVAPVRLFRAARLWERSTSASMKVWRSMKRWEGSVRWVCNLQELASWPGGGCREAEMRESWRIGCRPVGWRRLGANVADVFGEDVLEEEDAGR